MLLLDLSAVACATPITLYYEGQHPPIEAVRKMLFKDIMNYDKLFSPTFGRMVVCIDSRPYWRSEVQPSYKQNRNKAKEKSEIDWDAFGADISALKEELKEHSNFIVIDIQGAEADDVIAVLTEHAIAKDEKVNIVTSDKDMLQLQVRHADVFQFSPNRNKLLTLENTEYCMLTHLLKGDVSDGIPNVFSPDNFFMIEGDKPRQKSITKKIKAEVAGHIEAGTLKDYFDEKTMKRFEQNQQLIDTTFTPKGLQETIVAAYEYDMTIEQEHNLDALLSPFECDEEDEVDDETLEQVKL